MKITSLFFLLLVIGCGSPGKQDQVQSENETTKESLKPVSELTYVEIWEILLEANDSQGFDFHGDPYGSEGLQYLSIVEEGECAAANCGGGLKLKNAGSDTLKAVIKFTFNLPGNPTNEMFRSYTIAPVSTENVGCSSFCYDGNSYPVDVSIESAGLASE